MMEPAYDKSHKVLYQTVVVLNIIYYCFQIRMNVGVFNLLPMPIGTLEGLIVRMPFVHCILNLFLLLHCLFIKHWYVVFLYSIILIVEATVALGTNHILMTGYSWGQSAWGGMVLLFYLLYRWKEASLNEDSAQDL